MGTMKKQNNNFTDSKSKTVRMDSVSVPEKEIISVDAIVSDLAEKIFYGNLIEVIVKHCSARDIITLAQVFPSRKRILQRIFRQIIVNRIDDWFRNYFSTSQDKNKYQEFVEAMIKDNAVISGSFIIQMILDEKWEGSDIDIFSSAPNLSKKNMPAEYRSVRFGELFTLIEHVLYSDMTPDEYDTDLGHWARIANEEDLSDGGKLIGNGCPARYRALFGKRNLVRSVREYPLSKARETELDSFQIITVHKDTNIRNFVNEAFDFDICKNVFQYVSCPSNMTNQRAKMYLRLSKPLEIVDRVTGFKATSDLRTSLARCKKYMARGFKFYDDLDNCVVSADSVVGVGVDFRSPLREIQQSARTRFNKLLAEERKDI